jgi:ABC-2 type transport system ATP-binding protein
MADVAVDARNLSRRYGDTEALRDVSLTVERGEIFGLVGPDGAGKSTLLKILATIIRPTSGSASVLGFDIERERDEVRRRAAFTSEEFTLYGDLTVEENLAFFGRMFGLTGAAFELKKKRLLEFSRLEPFLRRRADELSGGMKQKLALSCALIREPELIFLDEPTRGVDPLSRRELWRILSEVNAEGVTLIVSTPYLDEASRCGRIAFLFDGQVRFVRKPSEVLEKFPYAVYVVACDEPLVELARARELTGVVSAAAAAKTLRVVVDPAHEATVARTLAEWYGRAVERAEPDLETVLLVETQRPEILSRGVETHA